MNCLKRAGCSILYHYKTNLLLVLLFTALATLVLSGFSIRSATVQESAAVRKKLGGEIVVYVGSHGAAAGRLRIETADRLLKLPHVKSGNFVVSVPGSAVNFQAVKGVESSAYKAGLTLLGVTNSSQYDSFADGSYRILRGKHFTDKGSKAPCAMVEKTLAEQDGLKPGDRIAVAPASGAGRQLILTVSGIYQNTGENTMSSGSVDKANLPGNRILIPFAQALLLTGGSEMNYADFEMDDPANIDLFRREARQLGLPQDTVMNAQDDLYEQIAGPLDHLNTISVLMAAVVLIAGAGILFLIVLLNLRGRNFEIGVLLSMGERRRRIIAQMMLEILVPVLIAFSLSVFTGRLAAQQIGSTLYSAQTQTADAGWGNPNGKAQAAAKIHIEVGGKDLAELYCSGILLALLSSAVPLTVVMRYRPKEILSQIDG